MLHTDKDTRKKEKTEERVDGEKNKVEKRKRGRHRKKERRRDDGLVSAVE